jgi:hypothetical protein
MNWEQLDWPALDRLRAGFISGSAAAGPYWTSLTDLASYDLTYAERIGSLQGTVDALKSRIDAADEKAVKSAELAGIEAKLTKYGTRFIDAVRKTYAEKAKQMDSPNAGNKGGAGSKSINNMKSASENVAGGGVQDGS